MTSDRLAQAVREQVAMGRVLPLGGSADAAWITEQAAARVLRTAAAGLGSVRITALRIGRDGLVAAEFEATVARPLPFTSDGLRRALWDAAHDRLGLEVTAVDLTVTGLLDEAPGATESVPDPLPPSAGVVVASSLTEAVRAVPGVAGVTSRLGDFSPAPYGPWVQIAVAAGHRALDVARAVAEAVGPVTVVVTEVA
ncbi:hypothetical protein ACFXJ5_22700 [Streptomyces sp. NPDC059373]